MDLGSLLGGLADDSQGKGDASQDPMSDLLGALLGGAQGGAPNAMPNQNDQVLGSLGGGIGDAPMMGEGGAPMGGGGMSAGGADLGGLLGSLLGGGGTGDANADPMAGMLGGLLGGIMGGGASGASASAAGMGPLGSILAPLADTLAEKTGIPREAAMSALAILIPMLMSKLMSGGGQQNNDPLGGMQRAISSGEGLNLTRDEQDEMIQQLTAQTGMDQTSAAQTLNQAMQVLGGQ